MKKIVLTGGGTAGHVTPNIALIPALREKGYEIEYIGSLDGIEKKLIEELGIPYHGIPTGKLRRYLSVENLKDPFRVVKGVREAKRLMKEIAPDVVFSKGGFVSVPVVLAASSCKVPAILHESDMTPGLANKICIPKASKICCNFPETLEKLPKNKAVLTGTPIRHELFEGNALDAMKFCGFTETRPTLLVIGGSTGALHVNEAIWHCLDRLTEKYNVIHLCGKGKTNPELNGHDHYVQYEYIKQELAGMLSLADVVVSRAGANAICELLALRKPSVLIPLPRSQSRGDQILNAESFAKSGYAKLLPEEEVTDETLFNAIDEVFENNENYVKAMELANQTDAITMIVNLIEEHAKKEAQ